VDVFCEDAVKVGGVTGSEVRGVADDEKNVKDKERSANNSAVDQSAGARAGTFDDCTV
jgi:hypothetical protein